MHGWDGGWNMGWMSIWWILGLAVIALAIWAVLQSVRPRDGAGESPEEVLKQRYARGEIDRDTYQRMLTDLKR